VALPQYLLDAQQVADRAALVRQDTRRAEKPGDSVREKRLDATLDEIDAAMKPVRSAIGRIAWGAGEYEAELRDVSRRLQYERRQLKKMQRK